MVNGDSPSSDPSKVGLFLAGGGARCAYQAGALMGISRMLPGPRNPFGVIAGQSAGAINAAGLASRVDDFGRAVRHLVRGWSRLRNGDIIRCDPAAVGWRLLAWMLTAVTGRRLSRTPRSLFDNAPLGTLVAREIDPDAIAAAIAGGHLSALALTATAYARGSGQSVTFFSGGPQHAEWARARRRGVRARLGTEHVLASMALPLLFPAQRIGDQFYADGALRQMSPLSPAIRLGARRLLVIAAREPEVTPLEAEAAGEYPSPGTIAGHMLDIVFNDGLDNDLERLDRINDTLSLMTPAQRAATPLHPIETFVLRPSRDLREIAGARAASMPWAIRTLLKGIGGWGGDWRLPSYLNFDGAYCRDLVRLGLRDALAHEAEIREVLLGNG